MNPTLDLIAAIRKECPADRDPDEWLASQLDKVRFIKNELATYRHAIMKAEDDHAERIRGIQAGIRHVRDDCCPHWVTTRHGDPAGGSDSYTECDICGKDLGK